MAKAQFDDDIFDDDEFEDEVEDEEETEEENDDGEEESPERDSGDGDDEESIEEEDSDGTADDDEEIDDEEDEPKPPKRKPGRPPKKKTGTTTKKRKPGRPKKSDDDGDIKVLDEDYDSTDDEKGTPEKKTDKVQSNVPNRRRPIDTEEDDTEEDESDNEQRRDITADGIEISKITFENYEGRNIEEDRKLNRYRLDEEAETQAEAYGWWAERLAEAKSMRDTAKVYMEYTTDSTAFSIRRTPPEDMKITEALISNLVATDPVVRKAKDDYLAAQAAVNVLEAHVTAMEHRRSQIKNLTMLWIGGYYSVPGTSRDDENSVKVSEGIRDGLKKRSRDQFEEEEQED